MRTSFSVTENKNLQNPNLQKALLLSVGVASVSVCRKPTGEAILGLLTPDALTISCHSGIPRSVHKIKVYFTETHLCQYDTFFDEVILSYHGALKFFPENFRFSSFT